MKDRDMLSYIEFYTLKRYGYYYSFFNKQERGASLDYLSNIPSACVLGCNKNKALRRFSYILKKVVKMVAFLVLFSTKKEQETSDYGFIKFNKAILDLLSIIVFLFLRLISLYVLI